MFNIWLPIEDALTKYAQYTHLITASRFILPFNVVSERAVKNAFNVEGFLQVYSKTPSIGGFWSTHPVFRYALDTPQFFGRKRIFAKVSSERNIDEEMRNLIKMQDCVHVPKVLGFFRNEPEDIEELQELKPGATVGAVLVEEFVDSISLGHALIEEHINIDMLTAQVFEVLRQMHRFCAHRDLKHSHIRIRLDPKVVEELVAGRKERIEKLHIHDITIIDVETVLFFAGGRPRGSENEEENSTKECVDENTVRHELHMDMVHLISSLTNYMSVLEHDSEIIRRYFPMVLKERLRRFGILLDTLNDEYDIAVPQHLIPNTHTGKYLMEWMMKH